MINESHIESYTITLTTLSPVFIGSNILLRKTEYCYYPKIQKALFLDREKFFNFLVEKNLLDEYEKFIFSERGNLARFMQELGYGYDEMSKLMLYSTDAGDALDENRSLKDIHCFLRNKKNEAYIPGSSLKGALRTVILRKMISDEKYPNPIKMRDKRDGKMVEQYYLNSLNLKKKKSDILNDIMRTISISDSGPIDNSNMTLCKKIDIAPSGAAKKINVVRECIRPGVKINFALTIDKSFGRFLSVGDIRSAVSAYSDYYNREYLSFFPNAKTGLISSNSIILGGGSGYFSKNIVYPILGHDKAVSEIANYMKGRFRIHKHENDLRLGISPRMLKCTSHGNSLCQFGLCRVDIK